MAIMRVYTAKRERPYLQFEQKGLTEYLVARDENDRILFGAVIDNEAGTAMVRGPDGKESDVSEHTARKFFNLWVEQSGIDFGRIAEPEEEAKSDYFGDFTGKKVADFEADPIEDYVLYIMDLMEGVEAGRDVADDIDQLIAYIADDDMYSDVVDRLELAKHKLGQGEVDVALDQLRVAMQLAK